MQNAIKSGNPSYYYRPCLNRPGDTQIESKLKLLRKAFLRLENRDPELTTLQTGKTESNAGKDTI